MFLKGFYAFLVSMLVICSAVAKEYVIGVEAVRYYPLYDFDLTNNSRPSFTQEVLTDFFESHNYQYKLLPLPIKRFDRWFLEEAIDFKFPDNVRWGNNVDLNIIFSDPVVELVAGSYVLEKNADLPRERVTSLATILGFYPTLWKDRIEAKQTLLLEESTGLGVVKHMLHGNADATNIDENVINHNLKLLGQTQKIVLNKHIHSERFFYHLSTIHYPEIIEQFNQYLKDNAQKIEKLKQQYHIRTEFN